MDVNLYITDRGCCGVILEKLFFLRITGKDKNGNVFRRKSGFKLLRNNSVYFSHFSVFAKLFIYVHN